LGIWFFDCPQGLEPSKSNSPVGCWATGRAPSLPYDLLKVNRQRVPGEPRRRKAGSVACRNRERQSPSSRQQHHNVPSPWRATPPKGGKLMHAPLFLLSLRGAKRRGNLLVPFTVLHSKVKIRTGRLPRQGFALPRNDICGRLCFIIFPATP